MRVNENYLSSPKWRGKKKKKMTCCTQITTLLYQILYGKCSTQCLAQSTLYKWKLLLSLLWGRKAEIDMSTCPFTLSKPQYPQTSGKLFYKQSIYREEHQDTKYLGIAEVELNYLIFCSTLLHIKPFYLPLFFPINMIFFLLDIH